MWTADLHAPKTRDSRDLFISSQNLADEWLNSCVQIVLEESVPIGFSMPIHQCMYIGEVRNQLSKSIVQGVVKGSLRCERSWYRSRVATQDNIQDHA